MGLLDDAYDYWGQKVKTIAGLLQAGAEQGAGMVAPTRKDLEARKNIGGLLADFTPVVGGVKGTIEEAQAGNPGWAAFNAATVPLDMATLGGGTALKGMIGGLPAMVGMIKEVGKMPKKGILPATVTADMVPPGIPDMFGTGMSGTIKQMTTGDYLGRYQPLWSGEGKPFYAIGDDVAELKDFMLSRMRRSEAGTVAAKSAKFNQSLLGQLQKAGYKAEDFQIAHSTQSASEYLTHTPTGVKIRISDHDLPLHYDQPDVDLRNWMPMEDRLAVIKKAIGK